MFAMKKNSIAIFLLVLIMLFLASCSASPEAEEQASAPAVAVVGVETESTKSPTQTAKPSSTTIPPTVTNTPNPEHTITHTPLPTSAPTATPTNTPVPDEWLTPASHVQDIEQPPYVESECSDRFPCNDDVEGWEARIRVPKGFKAEYVAYISNAQHPDRAANLTSLTFGPDGLLYVATAHSGIYTVDQNEQVELYLRDVTVPTGLAFQPGTDRLYVSNRVTDLNVGGEAQISVIVDGQMETLIDNLPCCYVGMHGPNGIDFGPDGYGYVGIGGRADHGEVLDGSNTPDEMQPLEAIILRFKPDGSEMEPYAWGFRNPYDIAWDATGNLWATDNGRDGEVPDELHLVQAGGQHGYPYFDCPACFGIPEGVEVIDPIYEFQPHSVAAGITTYLTNDFPGYYNSLFSVLWTAMDFAERVVRITPDGEVSTFATGFAAPLDITTGPDGSLYVADYATGIIFKISYEG
jgi:glucose/arabinose dehydrogenase